MSTRYEYLLTEIFFNMRLRGMMEKRQSN